jgi:hypothetical protein
VELYGFPPGAGCADGRYWARTSDPQRLVAGRQLQDTAGSGQQVLPVLEAWTRRVAGLAAEITAPEAVGTRAQGAFATLAQLGVLALTRSSGNTRIPTRGRGRSRKAAAYVA